MCTQRGDRYAAFLHAGNAHVPLSKEGPLPGGHEQGADVDDYGATTAATSGVVTRTSGDQH